MRGKAYPKYRPSGVEWLGEVPEHWEVRRLKYQTSINDEALPETIDPDYELLYVDISSVDPVQGIVNKEPMAFENAPSRARRIVKDGDTIISTVRTYLRAISPIKSPEPNLIVSTGFAVIRPNKIQADYLSAVIRAPYFIEEVVSHSVGVSYPAINATEIGLISIPLPPFSEQQAIAAFLDSETGRIDALIGKKKRVVELLKEKRTALISRAVTKGLDAKVKMKPSGVEWLGEVPEHWGVRRIKYISTIFGRIGFRGYTTDDLVDEMDGAITLSPSNMIDGKFDYSKCTYISWEKYEESPEIKVQSGDVIIVKTGSTLGKVAIVENVPHQMTINPQLAIFKSVKSDRKFLFYFVGSPYIQELVSISNTGGTIPTMTQTTIGNYPIPLPPLPEQEAIAAFLDSETAKIDALVSKVDTAIEKLKEYRTALISAAVTGKIDIST